MAITIAMNVIIVIVTQINIASIERLKASSSFLGSIIATSYLRQAMTAIAETIAINEPNIPQSSGVYRRESTGDKANVIICEITVPVIKVITLLTNSDCGNNFLNFKLINYLLRIIHRTRFP